ncbi:DUF7674 family protein [Listeria welshimeri]|uniref:DUF7674 family protein n=1 Tax=Listeria welshimeri TaxID=1643 RepID=UPI001623A14A
MKIIIKKKLKKIFSYIEFLLSKNDSYTNEVVAFSVLESIEYLLKNDKKLQTILGEKTTEQLKEF